MTYTEKILKDFDELPIFSVPIIEGVASVRTFVVDVQIVKDFLVTKINQALAEDRARVVEIVGADKELKHQECISGAKEMCESCNGRQIINYEKQRIRTALFSLEKLTGKE